MRKLYLFSCLLLFLYAGLCSANTINSEFAQSENKRVDKHPVSERDKQKKGFNRNALPKIQKLKASVNLNNVTLTWRDLSEHVKLQEGFEDDWLPKNWSTKRSSTLNGAHINAGSIKWFNCDEFDFGYYGDEYIKKGEYSAAIYSSAPEFNWLISPEVNIKNGDELRFWLKYINTNTKYSNFRVMIKADGTWNQELFYTRGSESNNFQKEVKVNLQKYNNKSVQFAFVYENTNGNSLSVDHVRLYATNFTGFTDKFKQINIYRDGKLVDNVNNYNVTTWSDNGLNTGRYKYQLSFVNNENKESEKCDIVIADAYEKATLPFNNNFEATNNNWIFNSDDESLKRGQKGDFNSADYTFPDRDGYYIAVNTRSLKYSYCTDILPLRPSDLSVSGRVTFSMDYVSDVTQFTLKGRENQESEWKTLKSIPKSDKWKHTDIILPTECLTDGYQLALSYSTEGDKCNGIAIDNINVSATTGKKIELKYKDVTINHDGEVDLGLTKPETPKNYTLSITNYGSESVNLNNVVVNGAKFAIKSQPDSKMLAPKESTTFVITYNAGVESEDSDEATITIGSDAVGAPFRFNVKAKSGLFEWTYMLYLYEDGQGLDGNKDINEWEELGSVPGKVNYIVLYDCNNDSKDGIYYITKDPDGYNRKIISERISTEFNKDLNMDDANTLERFTIWVKERYPSKHYGCNVWDHGSGIFRGSAKDWKSACGDMKLWDLAKAVKAFKDVDNKGFDIFGFDVCLLGQVETVYALKDYVDVVIASEKTEPGDGWHYRSHFKMLNDNPKVDVYDLAENIVLKYDESYDFGIQGDRATTQSAVRTDYFKADFIPALNAFVDGIIPEIYENNDLVTGARAKAWYSDGNRFKEHKDLGHFLKLLKEEVLISDATEKNIDNLIKAYEKCIVATAENERPNTTGMKIWMPDNINNSPNKKYYTDATKYLKISETKWDEFLKQYADPIWYGKPKPVILTRGILKGRKFMQVRFIDNTKAEPKIDSREWSFSPNTVEILNGNTNKDKDISVKFLEPGEYSVTLKVTNANGTSNITKNNIINVRDLVFPAPVNVTSAIDNGKVTLNWENSYPENRKKTVRYSEDFEKGWLPAGWSVKYSHRLNSGLLDPEPARTRIWKRIDASTHGTNGAKYIHGGNYAASIEYQARNYNWLITDEINVELYDKLSFWLWYKDGLGADGKTYHTSFKVMIFADNRWEEVISMYANKSNEYNSAVEYDLRNFVGKTVKIAFVQEYTDGFHIAIDDVEIYRDAVDGAPDGMLDHYNIFRDNIKIAETYKKSFSQNIGDGERYRYHITSVYRDLAGESAASDVTEVINSTLAGNVPQNLKAILNESIFEVNLTWEEGAGANNDLQSYKIYRNDNLIATVNSNKYTDKLNKEEGYYTYKITAVYANPAGETRPSDEQNILVRMKGAVPENLSTQFNESTFEVTLNWDEGTGANADLQLYKVYRNNTVIATVTDKTYTDNVDKQNATYNYKVTAIYAAPVGETNATDEKTVSVKMKGAIPENLIAQFNESTFEVSLNWDEGTGANAGLKSYKVYRNNTVIATVTDRTYTDNVDKQNATYTYKVTAIYADPVGETDASNSKDITVEMKGSVPANLTAKQNKGGYTVVLNWAEGVGANAQLLSYKVYRNNKVIATVTDNTYTDDQKKQSGKYIYKITALYAAPVGETAPTNEINVDLVTTSINSTKLTDINVAPNPTSGNIVVTTGNCIGAKWYIYSTLGRLINFGTITDDNTSIYIDSKGTYLLRIESEEKSTVKKVIVK